MMSEHDGDAPDERDGECDEESLSILKSVFEGMFEFDGTDADADLRGDALVVMMEDNVGMYDLVDLLVEYMRIHRFERVKKITAEKKAERLVSVKARARKLIANRKAAMLLKDATDALEACKIDPVVNESAKN